MMFRTELKLKPWSEPLDYSSRIVTLGSCFANNLAQRLARSKFNVVDSPTGILFNPASIARSMELMMSDCTIGTESLVRLGQRWVSFEAHSSLSGSTAESATEIINSALRIGNQAIAQSDMVIVTLGTAWVYRLRTTGNVVANCHKQPASLFSRELLSVDECVEALERIVALAPRRLLLTLSPIRHIGDGLEDNSLSKSTLRVAIDRVCKAHPERVQYFPSYEIMLDDLRDYRFYASDMLHPSDIAVDYIVDKFYDTALSNEAKALKTKIDKIVQAAEHRPFDSNSEEYKQFCRKQLEAIKAINDVDLSKESDYFEQMLQINL
ncbi:MAG: GSCFA domain-containing protein [Alistipes sp.]|nr:GSCFA domain-containing protein [Alistipes sp.]